MSYSSLGSGQAIKSIDEIEDFFDKENIIDPRNGTLMEMDALSLYCIAEFESRPEIQERVIKAVFANLKASRTKQFWCHNPWNCNEIHLRFTSSAIRLLLIDSTCSGQHFSYEMKENLLLKHLSYNEKLSRGTWFLHDSVEASDMDYPSPHILNRKLGSSEGNMLILNTHIDTLITCLIYNREKKSNIINNKVNEGLIALDFFIEGSKNIPKPIQALEHVCRKLMFSLIGKKKLTQRLLGRVIKELYYFRLRLFLKKKWNFYFFDDGYTERDLCLKVPNFEYHLVNIWDISRFLNWVLLDKTYSNNLKNLDLLKSILLKGLDYALSDDFFQILKRSSVSDAMLSQLLETIILTARLGLIKEKYITTFFHYRGEVAPSPGLLGFDPVISGVNYLRKIQRIKKEIKYIGNLDIIPFPDDTFLLINFDNIEIDLDKVPYKCVWSSKSVNKVIPPNTMTLFK
ncbi:hypothetical protein RI844_07100 [Thalassotalea fonticola]|uniref:Uncharacterized protein n=1 Tax=Thalassotalea fonticola TaxID=3065649 RepID=A0ABZ0GTG4_9GAMM|nr:hypothetical protein RI844_07100 [Colwelliaceae bacterium S1-1]